MPNPNKYYSQVVPSESSPDEDYLVAKFPDGDWKCTCKDFFFRSHDEPDHRCKHIKKVYRKVVWDALGNQGLRSIA